MPCMPATKMKSPALAPRLQVPSALIAPGGSSVLAPFGDCECAEPRLAAKRSAATTARGRCRNIFSPPTVYLDARRSDRRAEHDLQAISRRYSWREASDLRLPRLLSRALP